MTGLLGIADVPRANPFTPDFGKQPHSHVGRDDLLRSLREGLNAGPHDNRFTSLLLGPRGSGKTVVLNLIEDSAQEAGWIVLPLDASTAGIEDRIDELISWAHDRHESMPNEAVGTLTTRTSTGLRLWAVNWQREAASELRAKWGLRRRLATLAEHAARHDTAVLLTLDEMHSGERTELRRLFADLQHITKREELPLAFLGAGLSEMNHTLLEDKKITFFQRCARFSMPPLSPSDTMHCLSRTVRDAGGTLEEDALVTLVDVAGTLPYRMQLAGYHAWLIADAPQHPINHLAATLSARETNRIMHERVALPTWLALNNSEQTMLQTVAALGGVATPKQIAEHTRLSASTLAKAGRHLVNIGCVATGDNGSIEISGIMSTNDIQQIIAQEANYNIPSNSTSEQSLTGRIRCAAPMPRAQARCILPRGHKGGHRSR